MTEVLYMDCSLFAEEAWRQKGLSMISEKRKAKLEKMKNNSLICQSLGAGVLLQLALEECGLGEKAERMKTGAHGKPYLEDAAFHFSLSHSGEYAVCAFSDAPIGIDLQRVKETMPRLTSRILTDTEKAYLDALPEGERSLVFYRLWARKESLLKWDGRGLRLPMERFSLIQDSVLMDMISFEGIKLYFQEYTRLLPKYALCLCDAVGNFPEKIREITAESLTKH